MALVAIAMSTLSLIVRPPLGVRQARTYPVERGVMMSANAQLKERLVRKALDFRAAQEQRWEQEAGALALTLAREGSDVTQTNERLKSPLAAEGFGNVEVTMDENLAQLRNETIALVEDLSTRSPTPEPFAGWRRRGWGRQRQERGSSPLEGKWMLLFTTGADATFRKTDEQGAATTYTQISAERGHVVNCVDFSSNTSKLQGFRVVVAGYPISADEVQLKFRRVKLLRRSRWLSTITIPLPPSRVLRALSRWASRGKGQLSQRGAGFKILYLDDDMRMHLTFDGQYFVQMRPAAYEAALQAAQAPPPVSKWTEQAIESVAATVTQADAPTVEASLAEMAAAAELSRMSAEQALAYLSDAETSRAMLDAGVCRVDLEEAIEIVRGAVVSS
jgi:hypothetical protein